MSIDIDRERGAEAEVMMTGAEPQGRQQQYLLRHLLLDALGDAGAEDGIGEDREVMAMLLTGRDGGQQHCLVARHPAQLGKGHFMKAHGKGLLCSLVYAQPEGFASITPQTS